VSGSDVRELTELSALLADLDRKPDALRILASLSAEPGQAKDAQLQLRTARLAQELKDVATVKEACARFIAASPAPATLAPAPEPAVAVGKAGKKGKGRVVPVKATAPLGPKCP
jgi:hypothetical protein